jgi:hypothetical protein
MVNPYTAQGLPRIYAELAPYLKYQLTMHERTGGSVYDQSGNGYNASVQAGGSGNSIAQMWSNGEPGALDFEGVNDHLNAGTGIKTWLDNGKTWSIEAWMDMAAFTNTQALIGIQRYISGTTYHYMIIYFSAGRAELYFSNAASTIKYVRANLPASVVANKPFHIAWTYDGSATASGFSLYVNGSAVSLTVVNNSSFTNTLYTSLTDSLYIMAELIQDTSGIQYFVDGRLYYFAGYNKVLTASQILNKVNVERKFIK